MPKYVIISQKIFEGLVSGLARQVCERVLVNNNIIMRCCTAPLQYLIFIKCIYLVKKKYANYNNMYGYNLPT